MNQGSVGYLSSCLCLNTFIGNSTCDREFVRPIVRKILEKGFKYESFGISSHYFLRDGKRYYNKLNSPLMWHVFGAKGGDFFGKILFANDMLELNKIDTMMFPKKNIISRLLYSNLVRGVLMFSGIMPMIGIAHGQGFVLVPVSIYLNHFRWRFVCVDAILGYCRGRRSGLGGEN